MPETRADRGREAEDRAAAHLRTLGCEILARNFRTKWGEIDIVALSPGRDILIFAEVRYRSRDDFGAPEETVVISKQRKLVRAAQIFLKTAPAALRGAAARFDVVALSPAGLRHIENAFEAS
jgi:putative endonuclease